MAKRNYLILGIIIILLIAGVLFAWEKKAQAPVTVTPPPIVQPTPVPTPTPTPQTPYQKPVGWKTYENKEFGFAFDYPGDWQVEEKKLDIKSRKQYDFYEIDFWASNQKDRVNAGPRISVTINNDKEYNTEEKVQESFKNYIGTVKSITTGDNIKGYDLKNSAGEGVLIVFGGKLISFGSSYFPLDMSIVNTFRLIKK